ncbi:carbonic anhydrase [Geoalkalibacter sp.]|uniref:carbonic anhydrase n=1 Tax=Geoalkalibacter sp. TaxID=3041440 RepID=UPI00272E94FC|nr:carbonic anhydrase [Geoalkalibacter sp.]
MRQFARVLLVMLCLSGLAVSLSQAASRKAPPDQVIALLKEGNQRFVAGKSIHPHTSLDRLKLAGSASQADYAYATVLACSDSRVPVERIFDAGVMDLFVVRVAGNVCDTDEAGSIEYGLAHVHTPLLVVLGHTQCGAVTAVTNELQGHGHALERNIPALVDNIQPAVQRAMAETPKSKADRLIPLAIEENVWQSIEDLFRGSPATRKLVRSGDVKVVGAIYDVETGVVEWLPAAKSEEILARVEQAPDRAMNPMADGTHAAPEKPAGHEKTVH